MSNPWIRRTVVACVAFCLAALATGCSGANDDGEGAGPAGGSATTGPAPKPADGARLPDPCAVLTQDEINEVSGLDFGPGEFKDQLSNDDKVICGWVSEKPFASLQVMVWTTEWSNYDEARDSMIQLKFDPKDATIPGANRAFTVPGIVGVDLGDLYLQVSYSRPRGETVDAPALELASKAVSRIS